MPQPRWYAESPVVRRRQRLADAAVVAVVVALAVVGLQLHASLDRLAGPGRALQQAGDAVADTAGVGELLADVPLVGDQLGAPFDLLGDAGEALRRAGDDQVEAVGAAATWTGLAVGTVPGAALLAAHVPRRRRWRRDEHGARLLLADARHGPAVLALPSLTRLPLDVVSQLAPDPSVVLRDPAGARADALGRAYAGRLGVVVDPEDLSRNDV